MFEACHNLFAIEERLKQELPRITLLGQIPLSDADFKLLRQTIKEAAAADFSRIADYGRLSFACFLVWMGTKHYDQGNYWTEVEQVLGRTGTNWQQRWGELFLDTLERYQFIFATARGLRYVTPILLHGGIPDSCLRDFFAQVLDPIIIGKLDTASSEAEQVVAEWRATHHYGLADKPVRRFLEEGGKPAADLLNRCLEMARSAYDEQWILPAEELGLPERVVRQFEQWWKDSRQPSLPEQFIRLSRPRIVWGVYGEARCLLPKQIIQQHEERIIFQVRADGQEIYAEEISGYRTSSGFITERAECELPPARKYVVSLQFNAQRPCEWSFDGLTDEGWLAFDQQGTLLRRGELPRRMFWLIFRRNLSLNPSLRVIEETEGAGSWAGYHGCLLDPSETAALQLLDAEGRNLTLPLAAYQTPQLLGELATSCEVKGLPLYINSLPVLEIPLTQAEEIIGWDVVVEDLTEQALVRKRTTLRDVVKQAGPNHALLSLDHPALLGEPRLGEYRVKLRASHTLGRDQQFHFAFVKDWQSEWKQPFYRAAEVPHLTLLLDPALTLNAPEAAIQRPDEMAEIMTSPDSRFLQLHLAESASRSLQITCIIPRLRWTVRGLANHSSLGWLSESIEVLREDFEASQEITLIVQLPSENISACIVSLEGANHQSQVKVSHGEARISLNQFSTTLSNFAAPLARFAFSFVTSTHGEQKVYPLLVRTRWVVKKFECQDVRQVSLLWENKGQFRSRQLRLWSLLQPWREPREFDVPDDAANIEISAPVSALPAGKYRVELFIAGEFETAAPLLPPRSNGQDVFDIKLGEQELAGELLTPTASFRRHLTRRFAGYEDNFDLSHYTLTETDLDDLARTLVFLVSEGKEREVRRLWTEDLREQIKQLPVREALRERIQAFAEREDDKARKQMLRLCQIIGLAVNLLMALPPGSEVRFGNSVAIYKGIYKWRPGLWPDPVDLLYLDSGNSTRKVPLSDLGKLVPVHL